MFRTFTSRCHAFLVCDSVPKTALSALINTVLSGAVVYLLLVRVEGIPFASLSTAHYLQILVPVTILYFSALFTIETLSYRGHRGGATIAALSFVGIAVGLFFLGV
jgi:hypothetical protein